jgi:hypothetical protein
MYMNNYKSVILFQLGLGIICLTLITYNNFMSF